MSLKNVVALILRKKRKATSIRLYRSIDTLPIWNYDRVIKTGDLRYLMKLVDYDDLPIVDIHRSHWERIQTEVFEKVGMGDASREQMDKVYRKMMLDLDEMILDKDSPKLSRVKTRRKQLEQELERPVKSQDIYDQVAALRAFFHVDFDLRKMSVLEYYKQIELYEKQIRQLQR